MREPTPHDPADLSAGPDRGDGRAQLLRLAVAIGAIIALAALFKGLAVLVVVLALVVMVMVHEFGHFAVAKLSGMKVTEFFLGFGPRLWSVRRGETEYGIKLIPAGGYVRIVGMSSAETVAPEDEARSYRQATFPRRLAVAVAGSAMHVVMALVLLWAMFSFVGWPTATSAEVASVTSFVGQRSPAQLAGIRPGDRFVSVDGHQFVDPNRFVTYIEARPGKLVHLVVLRDGRDVALAVRPVDRTTVEVRTSRGVEPLAPAGSKPTGAIGVELRFATENATVNPFAAVARSSSMIVTMTGQTFSGIAQVFSAHGLASFAHNVATAGRHQVGQAASSGSSSGQLLSIYGAVELGAQAARQNLTLLFYLLVAIDIFVGVVNLFPMLPLDGGHVAIAVYERLRSRRGRAYHADVTKLTPVVALFVAFMVVIGLAALYANIVQPVTLPGG